MMARDTTIEELKSRVAGVSIQDRSPLCIEISERELRDATASYAAGDSDKGQAELADVSSFSGLARDYAIQSHRNLKKSEIAIRKMTRKLTNLKHMAVQEDQKQIQDTIDRLEAIRDDLLAAMFPNGVKR
jgi:hypothetical protein